MSSLFLAVLALAGVQVTWYGHACFLITTSEGGKILLDPIADSMPYTLPSGPVDVVAATHRHSDHNNVDAVESRFVVIGGEEELETTLSGSGDRLGLPAMLTVSVGGEDVPFRAVSTFHDDQQGAKRGLNTVIAFDVGGLTFCHLGDLGHVLTEEQVAQIGEVDVLFVPIGGHYTIDAREAVQVIKQLGPKVVFPMHYKTDVLDFPIEGVDPFLRGMSRVERLDAHTVTLDADEVESSEGAPRVIVLRYFQ